MFDINKNISNVPFFINNKKIFNGKEEKDYFVVPQEDGTELWYLLVDKINKDMPCDSYCMEKNPDGTINWIREICYINESLQQEYKIAIDKNGILYEKFPDGHMEQKSIAEAQQNQDNLKFGDHDSNGFDLSGPTKSFFPPIPDYPDAKHNNRNQNGEWIDDSVQNNPGDGLDFPPTQK